MQLEICFVLLRMTVNYGIFSISDLLGIFMHGQSYYIDERKKTSPKKPKPTESCLLGRETPIICLDYQVHST